MPEITGIHHIALPAADALNSGEWYERVLGFSRLLVEEEEDRVSSVALEHPSRIVLFLHQVDEGFQAWEDFAAFALEVPDHDALKQWEHRLTLHQVEHSGVRPAHLGWVLDLAAPDGFRIQLHTRPLVSSDDV
ncbi:VOC family protein [Actinoallomurus sp. NPDC050550]|uniref:VOC family protein n=1 Tax=Actinoallomurus sp. NPDC050550 TaxID=3154937 RepID=UPI0033D490EF